MQIAGKFLLIIFLIGFSMMGFTQSNSVEGITETILEDFAREESNSGANQGVLEDLHYFSEHPLNLNHASEKQLEKLRILNSFQIKSLKDYIRRNGRLLSIYELQFVFGYTPELVKKLQPFVTVSQDNRGNFSNYGLSPRKMLKYSDNSLLARVQRTVETPVGYKNPGDSTLKYLGNMYRFLTKYKINLSDKFNMGFTMEKDPGEEFFSGNNKYGFDYYSFHFLYQGGKWLKTLAMGDYQLNFGQGLTLWSGFSLSKSAFAVDLMKTGMGVDDYSSANENNFFRGAATEHTLGDYKFTLFYSGKNIDASMNQDDEDRKIFSSFQSTGYHRTETEVRNERALNEKLFGANITYKGKDMELGLTGVKYWYDGRRELDPAAYSQFQFTGNTIANIGLNYRYILGNFYFYGEEAYSGSGFAALNGVNCNLSSDLAFTILHRYYEKDYYARFSAAFSENTRTSNEEGLYFGVNFKPVPFLKTTFYFDSYRFPWLRYSIDGPSRGYDLMWNLSYSFNKKNSIYLRIKMKSRQKNNEEVTLRGLSFIDKNRYRLHFSSVLSENIKWSNRVELSEYHEPGNYEVGWLVYQDIKYGFEHIPISMTLRYAFFDTDSYASRIYAYEHDVLYAFSIPAYYSKGFRTYMNLHYDQKKFDIYIKISQTKFIDKDVIGSGLNEIEGNTKREVKLQAIFKF